jgi:hypothetical protein
MAESRKEGRSHFRRRNEVKFRRAVHTHRSFAGQRPTRDVAKFTLAQPAHTYVLADFGHQMLVEEKKDLSKRAAQP